MSEPNMSYTLSSASTKIYKNVILYMLLYKKIIVELCNNQVLSLAGVWDFVVHKIVVGYENVEAVTEFAVEPFCYFRPNLLKCFVVSNGDEATASVM